MSRTWLPTDRPSDHGNPAWFTVSHPITLSLPALVSPDAATIPQTGWLVHNENVFLIVPEPEKYYVKVPIRVVFFLVHGHCLLSESSHGGRG